MILCSHEKLCPAWRVTAFLQCDGQYLTFSHIRAGIIDTRTDTWHWFKKKKAFSAILCRREDFHLNYSVKKQSCTLLVTIVVLTVLDCPDLDNQGSVYSLICIIILQSANTTTINTAIIQLVTRQLAFDCNSMQPTSRLFQFISENNFSLCCSFLGSFLWLNLVWLWFFLFQLSQDPRGRRTVGGYNA